VEEHRSGGAAPRRRRAVLGIAGLVAVLSALGVAPAGAQSTYTAQASATAVDLLVGNPEFPLVTAVEAAGPSAGVSLSSSGQGSAFAANPDPGETAAQLPATAAGLTGLPIPAYPFYVATTTGDSPASYRQPGLALDAGCDESTACRASTVTGAAPVEVRARASVVQASADQVTASSAAELPSFTAPGGVTIVGAQTSARVDLRDGRLTRRASLTVSRLSAPGAPVFDIADGTVHVVGTAAPVPFSAVRDALKGAGVDAQLFGATQSPDGVVAPVLRLTTFLPGAPAGVTQRSKVVLTVGGAHAAIQLGGYWRSGSSRPAAAGPVPGAPGARASAPAAALEGPAASLDSSSLASPEGVAGAAPVLAAAAPVSPVPRSFRVAEIYLALVVGAAVWLGATQAVRLAGVRSKWMS
jgi:hypothetical protein